MKDKKKCLFLLILISTLFSFQPALAVDQSRQVERFIKALIEEDFDVIFELMQSYQIVVSTIKADKPKVLWDELISEHYESRKAYLFLREGALLSLLKPPHERKIIETRGKKVYVSLKYKDVEQSPLIGNRLLKETIFAFHMSETGMYLYSDRVKEGDVYWENVPAFQIEWQKDLEAEQRWAMITEIEAWEKGKKRREKGETKESAIEQCLLNAKGEIIGSKISLSKNDVEKALERIDSSIKNLMAAQGLVNSKIKEKIERVTRSLESMKDIIKTDPTKAQLELDKIWLEIDTLMQEEL
ncbi:hypothetical protein ACFLRM_02485 [Acidobacteriota bacterium]